MGLTDADIQKVAAATVHLLLTGRNLPATNPTESVGTALLAEQQGIAALGPKVDAITTALAALPAAVAAALPPVSTVTTSGDFEVTGTLHMVEPAAS